MTGGNTVCVARKSLARHDSQPRRNAAWWCDQVTELPFISEASMTFLSPGERIDGTTAECAHLHLLLACFRASPPPMRLPDVTGCSLPDLLAAGIIDKDVFSAGYDIMAGRYGGVHHPAQGYRHIQMDATITLFGDLTGQAPVSPQSAALDLIRSYAHDCLHYATFRRYRLTDRGEIARVQYGINFRQPDGRTYSAPDVPGDGPTRNLGIVMEGATDAEATDAARQAAQSCGITSADPGAGTPELAFADVTGSVTADGIGAALLSDHPYARSLGRFGSAVTLRYRALLGELDASAADAHGQIVAAMISGDLVPLEAWLDARHGAGSFARMFRAPSFVGEPELVR
jgi:hypothetical protein